MTQIQKKTSRFLIVIAALACAQPVFGKLEFTREVIEEKAGFGEKEKAASFSFTNTGDYPITVTKVKTSCGCTTADLEKTDYAPGEKGEVKVVFDIGNREGSQIKQIYVYTNDLNKQLYTLAYKVDIPRLIELQPRLLYWRKTESATPKVMTVNLLHDKPIHVVKVINSNEQAFTVKLKEVKKGRVYHVEAIPKETGTPARATLTIVTDFPDEKTPNTYLLFLRTQ